MRMYLLHSTITLLVVIAHVHCGTLRQYGPDWLIPKPEPQVDSKRITAKSVFIAPNFNNQNVRCASGFREDASGRCVKLVHVNQAAQLDFLLQRLNAMYGAPVVNHSDKQPLQVAVQIPEEPVNGSSMPQTEEMYSQAGVPQGELSVDLLELPGTQNQPEGSQETTTENATKDEHAQPVRVKQPLDEAGLTSVMPVSENETDSVFTPNKEMFQVDEEPLVTFSSIDDDEDSVENTTINSENVNHIDNILPEADLPTVLSEDAGNMANITKNTSNVFKKDTHLGDASVPLVKESVANQTLETSVLTNHTSNETHSEQDSKDTNLESEQTVHNKDELVSHTTNVSADILPSASTINEVKSGTATVDHNADKVPTKSSDIEGITSSNFEEATTDAVFTSVTSSSMQESSQEPSTTQQLETNESTDQETNREVSTEIPTLATTEINKKDHIWETSNEQVEDINNTTEDELDYEAEDADVEADIPHNNTSYLSGSGYPEYDAQNWANQFPGHDPHASGEQSLVPSSNTSVDVDGGNKTVDGVSENEHINVAKNDSEIMLENSVSVNTNLTSTSTELNKETITSNVNVVKSNGTTPEVLLSASKITIDGVKAPPNLSDSSSVQQEVLKTDSTVQIIQIRPYEYTETVRNVSQELPAFTPEQSVQEVYPQPTIKVMDIEQEPQIPPIAITNNNEPVFKESVSPNLQFHNLNPIPNIVQHADFNPLPQMPLIEKAPELSSKYGGYPYPPLPPLNDMHPPYLQRRPQYPQNIPIPYQNPSLQQYTPDQLSGFIRFPTESVQPLHRQQVNTVRFPQEDTRSNGKYSRWGDNWRFQETTGQRPTQRYWAGGHDTQYPQGTNRRNYWVDSRPNRRIPPQNYY